MSEMTASEKILYDTPPFISPLVESEGPPEAQPEAERRVAELTSTTNDADDTLMQALKLKEAVQEVVQENTILRTPLSLLGTVLAKNGGKSRPHRS